MHNVSNMIKLNISLVSQSKVYVSWLVVAFQ